VINDEQNAERLKEHARIARRAWGEGLDGRVNVKISS
jgi:hypothetical protein